jgi:GDP-4-dehydro-6-deoxy-D-mannose reductase
LRILVTGATGFVGRWLVKELGAAGHEPIAAPSSAELDISDADGVTRFIDVARPDAVAHFAGVAYAPDASRDPSRAFRVNELGTRVVISAIKASALPASVLVAGSAEVYGRPEPRDLPLRETAPLRAEETYGKSKLAQERAALETGMDTGVPVAVAR